MGVGSGVELGVGWGAWEGGGGKLSLAGER